MDNNSLNNRKHGGFGFASAMMRYNAPTERYIRIIAHTINRFLFNEKHMLNVIIWNGDFSIIYDNDMVLSGSFDYVEGCRDVSFKEYDRVVIGWLEDIGCAFDKSNFYYEGVMLK